MERPHVIFDRDWNVFIGHSVMSKDGLAVFIGHQRIGVAHRLLKQHFSHSQNFLQHLKSF